MKTRTHVLVVLLATLLVAGSAVAAPQLDSLVAGNGLAFSTDFAYDKAFIRITGPNGFVHDVKIAEGGALGVTFDRGLVDGKYGWQVLVVEPISADIQAAMLQARNRGEKNLASKFNVASHTFTGVFSVQGGAMSAPAPASLSDADIPTKDIVQNDDVIMTFSLCVGNDCVNGESFGFDTMRLKENNLRIHFDDTSTTASFPSNDWRIEVNDTGNGGTNHWSVVDSTAGRAPFRIEAGASANALVVESDSDIGIGTLNPVVELHVVDGDSPTLRLEQNGSSGFTPQTFDMVSNEANFFIRDVTNGSQLPFRIKPGADSDTLFLAADNNVGIQTDSPGAPLHVRAGGSATTPANSGTVAYFQNTASTTTGAIIGIQSGNDANAQFWFGDTDDQQAGRIIYRHSSPDVMSFFTANSERVRIDGTGNVCVGCNDNVVGSDFVVGDENGVFSRINAGDANWNSSSSRTLKENIVPIEADNILSKISDVDVFTYDFIDGPKDKLGLIAEDFHGVFGRGSDKSINGQEVQMALWLAVQELTAQNRELQQRLEELEQANEVE